MTLQGPEAGDHGPVKVLRSLCLSNPAAARHQLERIGVDPAGIIKMLPKLEQHALLVPRLKPAAANIIKQEMLALGGDAAVARGTVACSVPHTDVLLIGTAKQLDRLCRKLHCQPFGLQQLSADIQALLNRLQHPAPHWTTSRRHLALDRPLLMGILNITPDSFSDGGQYRTLDQAVARAHELVAQGADLLDIGGESTRPGAPVVSAEQEAARILPVIEALARQLPVPISVDTWKSAVADAALSAGAEIINDISGLTFDPALAEVVARHQAGLVLMHTRGTPQQMQQDTGYDDLLGEVALSLRCSAATAEAAGVPTDHIVLDPGIGLPKDTIGNLQLLQRLPELQGLGYPLLVGTSRKSFIGKVLERDNPADRLFGTAATVALAVAKGARILRVHDLQAMRDVALMTRAICTA